MTVEVVGIACEPGHEETLPLPSQSGFSKEDGKPPASRPTDDGQPSYSHRRTAAEVRRCKKGERTDLKVSEWNKSRYADTDITERPIKYDGQSVPIPRVRRSDITPEWFYENAAKLKQPIIIEDALSDWPAMKRWTFEALEERFRHIAFKVGSDKKGRKLRLKYKYFKDYMDKQQDDSPLYLFETSMDSITEMSTLKEDYSVPDVFPHDWLNLMNAESRPPYRWWCIGPRRSGTGVHTDPLGTAAWNAVTTGTKRWVLFEPEVSKRVAKGKDYIKKGEDDEPTNYFDFILPRIKENHPEVKVYEGLQRAGDIIFVPGDWWHGVLNTEDCVAVTQNYVGPDNFETVWKRTRAEREKVAYLWFRNMQKFAPELHRWACELNERDGFRMRHERKPGEKPPGAKSGSSDSSSSDSSSDAEKDVVRLTTGLEAIAAGTAEAAAAPRKRRRTSGWDREEPMEDDALEATDATTSSQVLEATTSSTRGVASPMGARPAERSEPSARERSPLSRSERGKLHRGLGQEPEAAETEADAQLEPAAE